METLGVKRLNPYQAQEQTFQHSPDLLKWKSGSHEQ